MPAAKGSAGTPLGPKDFIDETYCLLLFKSVGKDEVEHEAEKPEPEPDDEQNDENYCQTFEEFIKKKTLLWNHLHINLSKIVF
jgi:hypothetical protein